MTYLHIAKAANPSGKQGVGSPGELTGGPRLDNGTDSIEDVVVPPQGVSLGGRETAVRGFDAELSAEPPHGTHLGGIIGRAIEEQGSSGWTLVVHRRWRIGIGKDRRALILWNVDQGLMEFQITRTLRALGIHYNFTTEWKKQPEPTAPRFVRVVFENSLTRDACYKALKEKGLESWRPQVGRTFEMRDRQRMSVKVSNRYRVFSAQGKEGSSGMGKVARPKQQSDKVKKKPEALLKIGSFNVRGDLKNCVGELEQHMSDGSYDIVFLQETRKVMDLKVRGYKFMAHATPDVFGGVGFLVSLDLAPLTTRLKPTFANQLWLKLRGSAGKGDHYLCSAYMPQESVAAAARRSAWDALSSDVAKFDRKGSVIVGGDLNAKIGKSCLTKNILAAGPYCVGDTSNNGRILLELMVKHNLFNLAGWSKPGATGRWTTRTDPNGTESQIDYFIASKRCKGSALKEFGVDETNLVSSDHKLIHATLRVTKRPPKLRERKTKRARVERLRDVLQEAGVASLADKYDEKVGQAFGLHYDPTQVADAAAPGSEAKAVVADFVGKLHSALETTVGTTTVSKRFSRPWFDKEVKEAIDKRRAAYSVFKQTLTRQHWNKYRSIRKEGRRLIRHKQKECWEKLMQSITDDRKHNLPKQMWNTIKRAKGKNSGISGPTAVRRPDGTQAFSVAERTEAWADYQHRLGQPSQDPDFDQDFAQEVEEKDSEIVELSTSEEAGPLDDNFSDEELVEALKRLKYYKAAGPDKVRNEALKPGGEQLRKNILKLFDWIHSREEMPADWASSLVFNLYKDGDATDPSNYRGISLISCLGKLYLSIWNARLSGHFENRLAEEQGGFRTRRSTTDQVFTLHETLLRRKRAGETTYCFFIDFKKAFDTVWHKGLWRRLWDEGVRGKCWRLLRSLYAQLEASVLVDGERSRSCPIGQGVRQGCPLSPVLFSCYINDLVRQLKEVDGGVRLGNEFLSALLYADDIVLTARSPEKLQGMINVVAEFCSKWRLSLNTQKSKVFVVKPNGEKGTNTPFKFRGNDLEEVTEYKYLGVHFTNSLLWGKQVKYLREKGDKALLSLRHFEDLSSIFIISLHSEPTRSHRNRIVFDSLSSWLCSPFLFFLPLLCRVLLFKLKFSLFEFCTISVESSDLNFQVQSSFYRVLQSPFFSKKKCHAQTPQTIIPRMKSTTVGTLES